MDRVRIQTRPIASIGGLLGLAVLLCGGTAAEATATAGERYAGRTGKDLPVSLTVSPDGSRVDRLAAAWVARCDSGVRFRYFMTLVGGASPLAPGQHRLAGGDVAADGTFSLTSTGVDTTGGVARASVAQTVTGQLGESAATGTWRAEVEIVDRRSGELITQCSTGTLNWRAPSPQRLHYGGYTSQQAPVTLQLSEAQSRVVRFGTALKERCSGGMVAGIFKDFKDLRIQLGGVFGGTVTERVRTPDGGIDTLTYTLRGRLRKDRASGTLRGVLVGRNRNKAVRWRCRSPLVRWQASQ